MGWVDDGAPGGGTTDPPCVETSYTSSLEVIERETQYVHRRELSRPGTWRRFAIRRVVVAAGIVAMGGWLLTLDQMQPLRVVTSTVLFLVVFAGLCALDVWLTRRRDLRSRRALARTGLPPGTLVRACYTPTEVTFVLPEQQVVLQWSGIVGALRERGLLVLEQTDDETWVIPDEALGAAALDVVRGALGPRLVER